MIGTATLVHRRIQKIPLKAHYLVGFASTFTSRPDRYVCVDTLAGLHSRTAWIESGLFEEVGVIARPGDIDLDPAPLTSF